ncbi:MAG: Asp23/Gls24 family envelope stress response protein [Actinobacteria bacterium]|nr:Asp23/Gls24 family envelope stress response protein [Actinomycetota bacterium]MBV8563144.1 Asp23/Gls24 family envelope stress response protein [Actinomycetota bacterium]
MAGQASISTDIIARYAADAAREVEGVRAVAESPVPGRRGVKVTDADGAIRVELHLEVVWGASIPELGRGVQARVREYLRSMADVDPATVDVVVDEVAKP